MAAFAKIMHVSKTINNITKLFTNLSLTSNSIVCQNNRLWHSRIPSLLSASVHTTSNRYDLMEFFDEPRHWKNHEVKVGRSWKKDELRLKSNSDLHKLWFVLLKERNMLLTMEEACLEANKIFPNPERLDKVADSMSNLETVVRERNKAYHMLETGETGERPGKQVYSCIGIRFYYRKCQHSIPQFMNKNWYKKHLFGYGGYAVRKFLRLYREKLWNIKRRKRNRDRRHVAVLMRKFPNMDLEALKEQFPLIDIDKIKLSKRARGHCAPN